MKLTDLKQAALSAAMRGGTDGWGEVASSVSHVRYIQAIEGRKGRRKCYCGCGTRSTHLGMANGICLESGCEFSMRQWVKDPFWKRRRAALEKP